MALRQTRRVPFAQVDKPTPAQAEEHADALRLFNSRPAVVVEGDGPRVLLAVSVTDSPSVAHPDVEVTLVAAGIEEGAVRAAVAARYAAPNEDTYDQVPALWNTYVLSVPQDTPLDLVVAQLERMQQDEEPT